MGAWLALTMTSICTTLTQSYGMMENTIYPHGSAIDLDTIKFGGGFESTAGLVENDGRHAAALSIWSVGEHHPLDRSDCCTEVFLLGGRSGLA